MRLSRRPLIGVAICWLLMSVACSQASLIQASTAENITSTTTKFVPYNASKFGLAIEYPENWKINERDSGIWFTSPVDSSGNVGVQIQPAQNMSLHELVKMQLDQYKEEFKDFSVLSSNSTTLSGNTANRTDYSFKTDDPKFLGTNLFGTDTLNLLAIMISTIRNDNLYSVTYLSTAENFDIFLPTVQKMLSTLKIH